MHLILHTVSVAKEKMRFQEMSLTTAFLICTIQTVPITITPPYHRHTRLAFVSTAELFVGLAVLVWKKKNRKKNNLRPSLSVYLPLCINNISRFFLLSGFHRITQRWPTPLDFSETTVTRINRIQVSSFKLLKLISQQNMNEKYDNTNHFLHHH